MNGRRRQRDSRQGRVRCVAVMVHWVRLGGSDSALRPRRAHQSGALISRQAGVPAAGGEGQEQPAGRGRDSNTKFHTGVR